MKRRGRTMILAGTGAAAAGVLALCFYLVMAASVVGAGSLIVRITDASVEPSGKDTVIRIACEVKNRTGKTVSFWPFSDLESALRMSLRLRLEGSAVDWRPVYPGFVTMIRPPRAHLLTPGAEERIHFEISSAHFELRTDGGAVMAIGVVCTSGQPIFARIEAWAYPMETGVEPVFPHTEESYRALENLEIKVESPAVSVTIKAGKN